MTQTAIGDGPSETIDFRLSADELKRLRAGAFPESRPMWMYFAVAVIGVARIPMVLFTHHPHSPWQTAFELAIALPCVAAYGALAITVRLRGRNIPATGSLGVSDSGFAGTLNGAPAQVAWHDMQSLQDIGDAIVLRRRRNQPMVIIPKSAIADLPALWSLLEDRLVSKRGLIRSRPPRRLIQNSAYWS